MSKNLTKEDNMDNKKHYLRSTRNLYFKNEGPDFQVFYSYSTPVAYRKGCSIRVSENVWSVTTAKHLNWIEDHIGLERKSGRDKHSDFKEHLQQARSQENKAPDQLKVVGLASAMFGLLSENDKEAKVKYQKRFYEKVPGLHFPDDWDQLSTEEKEKRLNNVTKVALEKREG